ncbi:hypothetical protein DQ237_00040 [Blastococcus sp. TF02-8]|uniref:hypothetical protein n=1 Tax=Blastococcus sp. TF02-8 TaxID=2250574 RepID=UPI000DEA4C70|nr:hypothetical protein [Blastococcus sp. TF02-8]RBY97404.1 hypothetical protein DQ237_00040 [Blastococcus sp. TF02-8]
MTEPSEQRPVPGPPRPGPSPTPAASEELGERLEGLDQLPVAEHVAVFEAEHERLQRELGTIDPR